MSRSSVIAEALGSELLLNSAGQPVESVCIYCGQAVLRNLQANDVPRIEFYAVAIARFFLMYYASHVMMYHMWADM